MDRALSVIYRASIVVIFLFMLLPLIVVLLASVSPTEQIALIPSHMSLRWYAQVLEPRWLDPMRYSLELAAIVAISSTLLGGLGAFAVAYYRCPMPSSVSLWLLSPLAAPQIVKGIALLQFFSLLGLQTRLGMGAIVLGHLVVMLPFAARMIMNSLHGFDRTVERAAVILGADHWRVLWYVTLPLLKPGIFAALAFSFVLSFNNVEISLFLSRPGRRTLPIEVINYFAFKIDPALAAVNMATLIVILGVILVLERIGGFSNMLYRRAK